jgi:hypothetical protein
MQHFSRESPAVSARQPRAAACTDQSAPPCFYWSRCAQRAALEKSGRSVCRRCAATLGGSEYPLRNPCAEPLYVTGRVAAEALDMLEDQPPARGLEVNGLRVRPPTGGRVFTTPAR